jgi:predicted nucleic acid-binding protein
MLTDIVIDTNVWVHATNPAEERCDSSKKLLALLRDSDTLLGIDPGFSVEDSRNRSLIGREYLDNIGAGSESYAILVFVLQDIRIKEITRTLPRREAKLMKKWHLKPRDRTFLAVAFNSSEKTLASHDFEDFPPKKRLAIEDSLGVDILEAEECCPLM